MTKISKGFTLIELLVVVFIIGLLAGLVIINVNNSRKTARDAKRVANLKSIQTALEMYNQKAGTYPTTLNGTNAEWQSSTTCGDFTRTSSWLSVLVPTYISVLPTDPKLISNGNSQDRCYAYKSDGTDYMLMAWHGMESSCPPTGTGGGCGNSDSVSIKEMARPNNLTENSIAVYSSGAPAKSGLPSFLYFLFSSSKTLIGM